MRLDTIPSGGSLLKVAGEFIYETTVDTANTVVINEFLAINSGLLYDNAGDDDDWFEIYNYGDLPILVNDLCFTDNKTEPCKWKINTAENFFLDPGEHMLFWADGEPEEGYNHTSFRLSGDGEYLGIYNEDTTLLDQCYFGVQTPNISYGRFPDAGLNWYYFDEPSPNAINSTSGAVTLLPLPSSNQRGGVFTDPLVLRLSSSIENARIVYTTDCTEPDSSDSQYNGPIEIDSTTIFKSRLVKQNSLDGPVLTISFIFDDNTCDNPVISLVAEPDDFYGDYGLISKILKDIEIPANFEYMEQGRVLFSSGTGIQLHAAKSITPNSLRLYARSRYGNNWFEYPFYKNDGPELFKRLILRNSGNDNVNISIFNTHFRDPLIHKIAKASNYNPMISESRPVNVFLNGSYYGIFNLRERIDEHYITTHTGETGEFDLLERVFGYDGNRNVITGSFQHWDSLLSFVDTTGDLSLDSDLKYVAEQVDLKNFTDYWITEVFVGNFDWLSNNIKFWKAEQGKWQWIYWDTDHGLGLVFNDFGNVNWNTLEWSLTINDRTWANGFNNILIRNLLKNDTYRGYFIRRFTYLLNTSFSFDSTGVLYDAMIGMYHNDMIKHAQKWNNSMDDWENACGILQYYLMKRPDALFGHLKDYFKLEEPVPVSIKVEPPGAGTLSLIDDSASTCFSNGKYFPDLKYNLIVESTPGFSFAGWSPLGETSDTLEIQFSDTTDLIAYFVPINGDMPLQVTEVFFNNWKHFNCGDWIEFYYYGIDSLDLSGCSIIGANEKILYTFDQETTIYSGEYFLVAEDLEAFKNVFPDSINCFGNFKTEFSDHYKIALRSPSGEVYKEVELFTSPEWPVLPDEGFSLELKSVVSDSGNGNDWEISENIFGSPGLPNHLIYDFHKPIGKDSTMSNREQYLIPFASTHEYYSDLDGHDLAGIFVKDIQGPGEILSGNVPVTGNEIYEPSDFQFNPREPYNTPTILNYSFIDQTGQESYDHSIQFLDVVGFNHEGQNTFKIYPTPAQHVCYIEIPPEHKGPIVFYLFDLNGKILKELHREYAAKTMEIDLSKIEDGMYFYLLKTNMSVLYGKIEVIK